MPAVNLAPWKYRNLLLDDNPIFKRLCIREKKDVSFDYRYEAYAYLHDQFRPGWLKPAQIYGDPDGTGTSGFRNQAYYKAISEALERWAFYETLNSVKGKDYGFDVEPSTAGMAAFPGLFKAHVRKLAMQEAIERWSVCSWWEGTLPITMLNVYHEHFNAAKILHPWLTGEFCVVLIWSKTHPYTYSFACDQNLDLALSRAEAERIRNVEALKINMTASPEENTERRLVYFSTEEGRDLFCFRVKESLKGKAVASMVSPKKLVDSEIKGSWSKYTTVWRVLFEMPSDRRLEDSENYFLF